MGDVLLQNVSFLLSKCLHQSIQERRCNCLHTKSTHLDFIKYCIKRQQINAVLLDKPEIIDEPQYNHGDYSINIPVISPASLSRQKTPLLFFLCSSRLESRQQFRDI